MARLKNILFAISVVLTIGCLSLGFFINQMFLWSRQHVAALLNSTATINVTAVKLGAAPKTHSRFRVQGYGATSSSTESFSAARAIVGVSPRSFIVTASGRINFYSKVSRYIFKSVLNI